MYKFLKYLFLLPILFFFLPALSFYVPGMKALYQAFYIILYIVTLILIIINYKYIHYKFTKLIKYTPLKSYIIFWCCVCLLSFILSFTGVTTFTQTIRTIIMRIFLCIVPLFLYFSTIIGKYITLKEFIKIFMLLFWINLIAGFIAYFGRLFDISIINNIFDILANNRILKANTVGTAYMTAEVYASQNKLVGLYEEPGYLGQFLFFFLPFVYTFSNNNINLFNNFLFNSIFKNTLVPFTLLNIVLTKSPITLVFCLILTTIYYKKNIYKFLKKLISLKNLLIILIFITIIFSIITNVDINYSDTYLSRIINVVFNIRTFEEFILIEPSLATRVASYINEFCIFLQHPFTGVGFGNLPNLMYSQFQHSIVPLTSEIIYRSNLGITYGLPAFFMPGFIYAGLAEHGIFVFSIFMFFYVKLYINIAGIQYKVKNDLFMTYLIKSIKYSLICFFIEFIYDLYLYSQYLILIIILSILCIYYYKQDKKLE